MFASEPPPFCDCSWGLAMTSLDKAGLALPLLDTSTVGSLSLPSFRGW